MIKRRFLAGCLALAVAFTVPAALAQRAAVPVAPAQPATPLPPSPTPSIAPAPLPAPAVAPPVVAPAPAARYESRAAESREYSFDDDTVSGDLARPDAAYSAGAAAAPPDVPAYSDLCKASPKPPWCSDAPKGGSGN